MEETIAMKYNRRIFPIYKGLTWDPLFYSAIIFLFLTQEKNFEPSIVLYAEAIYYIFLLVFQLPSSIFIEHIGSRKTLIIGSIATTIQITLMIFVNNFFILILAYFLNAFSNAITNVALCDLLYDSTKNCTGKSSGTVVDAKGSSVSYILNAITTITSGYLFIINPYIPIILSGIISAITIILAYRFEELHIKAHPDTTLKDSIKDTKQGLKFIIHSERLKAFFLFISFFSGILMMISTYEKSLLSELQVPAQYFGIIFSMLILVQFFAVKYHGKISKKFRNKTLTFLSVPIFISFIVIGIITKINIPSAVLFTIIITCFFIQHALGAPYWILEKKYITNFTNSKIRVKILSAGEFIASIGKILLNFIGGLLLEYYSTNESYLILGSVGIIILLLILQYMKKRFGLKPHEYKSKDIKYSENV